MAELFRVRAKSGRVTLPPRLASRLHLTEPDRSIAVDKEVNDGDEFEILIDDQRRLDVKGPMPQRVIFTPSDSETAEYRELERHLIAPLEMVIDQF